MNISEMFPSKYLRATDLQQPVTVRIRNVSIELLGKDQESKPVCFFVGETKPLILNKTNCATLITITGSEDSDDWVGQKVELYRDTILIQGQRTPALRIRAVRGTEEKADDVLDSWDDELTGNSRKKPA